MITALDVKERGLMRILLTLLACLFLTGCGKVNEETLREILGRDPSFAASIDIKNRVTDKISAAKEDFIQEKKSSEEKIFRIREALAEKKADLDGRVSLLEKELEPLIDDLNKTLQNSVSAYSDKKKELRDLAIKLKNIGSLLEKKGDLSLSGDEVSIWNKRVNDLKEEMDSVGNEIDRLKDRIRLLKVEIKILKE